MEKNDSSVKKLRTFSISGNIKNKQNGQVILSQAEDINRKKSRIIGALSIDEAGNFSQTFDLEPHIYRLDFYGRQTVTLAIDSGQQIEISIDGGDLSRIEINGSEDTEKLLAYEKFRNQSLEKLVKSVRREIASLEKEQKPANREKIEQLGVLEIENYETHKRELNDFIKNKMGISIALYPTTLRWDGEDNIPFYGDLAASFAGKYPGLNITKRIQEKVEILKNTGIGGKSAGIRMPDKLGREIPLESVKGKYILIDFWASWCGPCRRESKTLADLYLRYKDRGFNIYGVSLDSDRGDWLQAIEKDGRIWTNVSTLEEFETPATFEYGVTALPAKFLIDGNGMIIAKNLHGNDLRDKIKSLFGE